MTDNLSKDLKKLDEIQKHWEKEIDNEIKSEEEIATAIESITDSLYLNNKIKVPFNGTNYMIGLRILNNQDNSRQVLLIVSDIAKYTILGSKYMPAMVRSDIDERYDIKGNIRTAVEGWVRHITGTIKPEYLDQQ